MTTNSNFIAALIAAASVLSAQSEGKLSAPRLGHLLDAASGRLLRIDGIAGSSHLAADTDRLLVEIATPASGRYVAAIDSATRQILIRAEGSETFEPLAGTGAPVTMFALSPSGERLALTDGYSLQVWSGLPAAPQLESTSTFPQEGGLAMAVADKAAVAVVRKADGALIDAEGAVLLETPVSAVAFRPGASTELVALAGEEKMIWRIAKGSASVIAEGVKGVNAVRWAANGRIYAVSAQEKTVFEIDARDGALLRRLECDCAPELLEPLAGEATFRLTAHKPGEPLWIVNASASNEARVLFVPAYVAAKGEEE